MHWLTVLFDIFGVHAPYRAPSDDDAFARRERDLRARLKRLTQEVDVIQRADTSEESRE